MEYQAYFGHSSFGPDEFYNVIVELDKPDLTECLAALNQVWEVAVSCGMLEADSFLAEVRVDGEIVWSVDEVN
ncbi:MAG: hypothetical protein ACXABY_04975 [Candidatus Thorarchaeota archaeon]|jgi:hypothetical protein